MDRYGQLLFNASSVYAGNTGWYPGKLLTLAVLQRAAQDPAYARAVASKAEADPASPLTLADLVALAFDTVLMLYSSQLPFNGYWVRAAKEFVLRYLGLLPVPSGLRYRV
jgi:hypothetical protein